MKGRIVGIVAGVVLGLGCPPAGAEEGSSSVQAAKGGTIDVRLCDGETSVSVPSDLERTRANGQTIADELMTEWRRKHPEEEWVAADQRDKVPAAPAAPALPEQPKPAQGSPESAEAASDWVAIERSKHTIADPYDNRELIGRGQGATYGQITQADVAMWERQSIKFVAEGSRVFHSADELGSTIAVSCDMCHPNAANTHPETYPKFQVQLGRVALLRDMINWCIEHPLRGQKLAEDDPRMRALEAYIYAQRSGTPLLYGKR